MPSVHNTVDDRHLGDSEHSSHTGRSNTVAARVRRFEAMPSVLHPHFYGYPQRRPRGAPGIAYAVRYNNNNNPPHELDSPTELEVTTAPARMERFEYPPIEANPLSDRFSTLPVRRRPAPIEVFVVDPGFRQNWRDVDPSLAIEARELESGELVVPSRQSSVTTISSRAEDYEDDNTLIKTSFPPMISGKYPRIQDSKFKNPRRQDSKSEKPGRRPSAERDFRDSDKYPHLRDYPDGYQRHNPFDFDYGYWRNGKTVS